MKPPRIRLQHQAGLLAFVAVVLSSAWFVSRPESVPTVARPGRLPGADTLPRPAPSGIGAAAPGSDLRLQILARLAYAQAWDGPLPRAMAAFRAWTERYGAAPSLAARLALEPEGVVLARNRRPEMRRLIVTDPERALAVTVPALVRQQLPTAVLAELETRHSGRGDFALQASQPEPGTVAVAPPLRRIIYLGGQTYTARPYGRRESQMTKEGTSLHGIALDDQFAVHESPLRVLEPREIPEQPPAGRCAACALAMEAEAAAAATEPDRVVLEFIEIGGLTGPIHEGELVAFEQRLATAEDQAGPRVLLATSVEAGPGEPPRAADAPTAHTIGTKQVLVIRADFSDFPGEPISQSAAQGVIDGAVKSFTEDVSYGLTSVVATVSGQLYRLPRTGAAYATAGDNTGLHGDARAAASAQYTLANYDRVIVVFPNIGTSRVTGSRITYAGLANVGGTNSWINGPNAFVLTTVSHELGHTHGLLHGNLWRVADGNAVSAAGNSLEYGDAFDMMGSTSSRDARHHYSMWAKNRLGWLPDNAVTTVATSGTYRIHRFDSRAAPRTQPLALRIFRDGVRWYWVGLRQNFSTGLFRGDGAYVIWGYNQRTQTQLLDLNTPGNGTSDATLAVGGTFTDPTYGVSIKVLARGGAEPAQWLDLEITIPDHPPNVVAAWGREGTSFFDTETGEDIVPAPETNVPMELTGIQAIAAGRQHALALKPDGTVVAWGNHTAGQIAVPEGLAGVIAIAAGGDVSGAVLRDGTVRLWGDSTSDLLSPPAGLRDVRRLAIGRSATSRFYHALALTSAGTVVAWGDNSRGQTAVPAGLTEVVAIAAGDLLSVALRADGSVARWGTAFAGAVPFPAGLNGIAAIAAGGSSGHALALRTDGTVVAWGLNTSGQASVPADLANVVDIAAGSAHSLALLGDGSVVAWGSATGRRTTVPIGLPRAAAVAASDTASFALAGTRFGILTQPAAQTVAAGGRATFRVEAAGPGPLTYQWRKDGVGIPGATDGTLTLAAVAPGDAGTYDVVVTNAGVTLQSALVRLALASPPPVGTGVSRIANLSIRTNAGTGAQTLIVGFVVGGAGTSGLKPLLIRGVGPTLTAFGVPGVLADPKVELYNAVPVMLLENDNWNSADAATFAGVGAFALNAGSRDAALFSQAIPPGSYSAQISGSGGASGIVLAEIYDVTSGPGFTAAVPRLVNVSARTLSGSGGDTLIAGFVIAGASNKTVLLRAIGPGLVQFGVTGVLANPRLDLFDSASTRIQENDNWGGSAALTGAFGQVGAFALQGSSLDAALLVALPPGSYTAQVSGVGGTTGVALVEVYEVP